jgi:ADP-ribosylglycohydrolase
MQRIPVKESMKGSLWGAVVGNALGVPVEFKSREFLRLYPVTDMLGYGTHEQPPGTWSEDSSLLICTVASLIQGFDPQDIGRRFVRWMTKGYWTPHGEAFDLGHIDIREALERIAEGVPAEMAGNDHENNNSNGSLMRILPVALAYHDRPIEKMLHYVHRASAITHAHPQSLMACGIYSLMVVALLRGMTPRAAYQLTIEKAVAEYRMPPYNREIIHFQRILSGEIPTLPETEIETRGYVVFTLEAALWCLLNCNTYREVVLKAVSLGDDTDTTACVAGGLAGICYGFKAVPPEWILRIPRRSEIMELFEEFINTLD